MDINIYLWLRAKLARPGRVFLDSKKELGMAQFGLKFGLPAPGASDVATRELTITTEGVDAPNVVPLPGNATVTDQIVFPQDAKISVTLVDIDAHGNRSPASAAFLYTVVDDIAPPQPGAVGVTEKVQID